MAHSAESRAQVQYRPASIDTGWWIAVEGGALAVLAPTASAQTADAVWRRVGEGGIGAVLDALTGAFGTSLTSIPPFALVVVEDSGVRVAVRGSLEVIVDAAGEGPVAVSGEGVATWAERLMPGASRVTVAPTGGAAEDAAAPLRSGVAVADLVVVRVAAPGASQSSGVAASVGGAAERTTADFRTPADRPAGAASADMQISAAGVVGAGLASAAGAGRSVIGGAGEGRTAAEIDAAADRHADVASADTQISASVDEVDAAAAAAAGDADTWLPEKTEGAEAAEPVDEYDLLWGETVARPITAAAVVTAVDDETDASASESPALTPPTPQHDDPAPGVAPHSGDAAPVDPSAPTALLADLPAAASSADLGDHDGATISVAEARALRGGEREAERERYESTDNVPPRRPARGRIVLSTGRVVELERPVVIGRRPKSTRTSGSELPTLVAVESPEQDISRSHVEIRAEGEHVLVTDLDTTNGTVLMRGGHDPVRLHPGEPTMVVSGDVLDLGDGVTVTFEGLS